MSWQHIRLVCLGRVAHDIAADDRVAVMGACVLAVLLCLLGGVVAAGL